MMAIVSACGFIGPSPHIGALMRFASCILLPDKFYGMPARIIVILRASSCCAEPRSSRLSIAGDHRQQ